MRRIIIKIAVCSAVFITALFVISSIMNKGNTDMTVEMGPATYPLVYINIGDDRVNCLHGYSQEMNGSYMRDSITPISESRMISLSIDKYGMNISKLSFEVRSVDGERLVEDTEIYNYVEKDDTIDAAFTIKDLIDDDTEYNFILLMETDSGQIIRYYTRIIQASDYHTTEKIEFVKYFHNCTLNKDDAKNITKYLESNSEGDNSTYNNVNIHSNFNQITWGDLGVTETMDPSVTIKEIGTDTASIKMVYVASTSEGKNKTYYNVEEFYRVRYGTDRMYLLEYERTMNQLFDISNGVFANNKISIGIAKQDIEMKESDGGNNIAFVDEHNLYSYNLTDNKFGIIFGFYDADSDDLRTIYGENDIKILSVDETGNIRFLVYGYMNRGRHEGSVGIQTYYYNGILNTLEEEVYIPYTKSVSLLENDIKQLSYVNNSNTLYLMLDGTIYGVDLEDKTYDMIASGLMEGSFEVSDSNRMIAWQADGTTYDSSELVLMNLNTKKQTVIDAQAGEKIAPLGFMEEDLVYGLAHESDIFKDASGSVTFPMYEVNIQNENNEVLKTYSQSGVYITDGVIEDNQLTINRVRKNEDEGGYIAITDDQIMNNQVESTGQNKIETAVSETYETLVQIAVKNTISTKSMKVLTPKEVLFEGGREITLSNAEDAVERYYVYGNDGIEGVYTDPGNAINNASDISGIVTNDKGYYVWVKGNRSTKNQIMAIQEAEVTEEKNSVAVCLDTILAYEGVMRNTEYMLQHGETVLNVLNSNLEDAQVLDLTGCSLDSVLYYVNRDIPVMAMLNDGNAVLIIGFNELNTVLMDPQTGLIYKKGINDSTEWFEENGNCFITYIR